MDCRYLGQSYFLNVKWNNIDTVIDAFQTLHAKRYGHKLNLIVEVVNLRVAIKAKIEEIKLPDLVTNNQTKEYPEVNIYNVKEDVLIYQRDDLNCGDKIIGPALITETVSTTYLALGWECEVHSSGCLLLEKI